MLQIHLLSFFLSASAAFRASHGEHNAAIVASSMSSPSKKTTTTSSTELAGDMCVLMVPKAATNGYLVFVWVSTRMCVRLSVHCVIRR